MPGEAADRAPSGGRLLDEDGWAALWRDYLQYAFRLETLPAYRVEDEAEEFASFLTGDSPPPECADNEWLDEVRAARSAGKVVQRVRTLTPPLTDYLRYEFEWGYAFSEPAGEDIRVTDLSTRPDLELPDYDFWLFDGTTVVRMHYEPDGSYLGAEIVTDANLEEYQLIRRRAIDNSVPFQEYWRSMKLE